jgi:hypothetical protein
METIDDLLYSITHLTVDQMLELAKGSDEPFSRRFRATGPSGSTEGVILDPFLGFIQFDGTDGFVIAASLRFANDITWELI